MRTWLLAGVDVCGRGCKSGFTTEARKSLRRPSERGSEKEPNETDESQEEEIIEWTPRTNPGREWKTLIHYGSTESTEDILVFFFFAQASLVLVGDPAGRAVFFVFLSFFYCLYSLICFFCVLRASVVKMIFELCPKTSNDSRDFGYDRGIWHWIGEYVSGRGCRATRALTASFSLA